MNLRVTGISPATCPWTGAFVCSLESRQEQINPSPCQARVRVMCSHGCKGLVQGVPPWGVGHYLSLPLYQDLNLLLSRQPRLHSSPQHAHGPNFLPLFTCAFLLSWTPFPPSSSSTCLNLAHPHLSRPFSKINDSPNAFPGPHMQTRPQVQSSLTLSSDCICIKTTQVTASVH